MLALLKGLFRPLFSVRQRYRIKQFFPAWWYRNDLPMLAKYFGTDKEGAHFYSQHYARHFAPLRRRRLRILEIGVGGLEDVRAGGESLRMWKAYFRRSQIVGIDIHDKTFHDEPRITTLVGDQTDAAFMMALNRDYGPFDIIIDDGSHVVDHVITTFTSMFPLLAADGVYVVEDTQTSYWPEAMGIRFGGATDVNAPHTTMNFFKSLVDGLNHEEYLDRNYQPTYFDRHIVAMHFYHNLVFVYKGVNAEGSNVIGRYPDTGGAAR